MALALPRQLRRQFLVEFRARHCRAKSIALGEAAVELAQQIASSAPLAVGAIRRQLRGDLARQVIETLHTEWADQTALKLTEDFGEGVRASKEKRAPMFRGR